MIALDAQERQQTLDRAVYAPRVGVGALVHWSGFLFGCVIPKRSPEANAYRNPLPNWPVRLTSDGTQLFVCFTVVTLRV